MTDPARRARATTSRATRSRLGAGDAGSAWPPPVDAADLRARLSEAEETLRAIRNGEVDALVVQDKSPTAQVFTLSSADRPYRRFVENMHDGAATISDAGTVLYANRRLAELLGRPLTQLIGSAATSFIANGDRRTLLKISELAVGTTEVALIGGDGQEIPVRIGASTLDVDSHSLLCLTFTDLTETTANLREIERLSRAQTVRMSELEAVQAALITQATHDPLTGLPNRHLLFDRLHQAIAVAQRTKTITGLMFVDLDGFKQVNDVGGHDAGDALLRHVAERLQHAIRPTDSVARFGGDEFVVLAPAVGGARGARVVAARIAAGVNQPVKIGRDTLTVTASIGISLLNPNELGEEPSPDHLLQRADAAMYYAKSLGGAQTQVFDPLTTPAMSQDADPWVARIREALAEGRFLLYAQPIIDLATGDIVRRELLLRMRGSDERIIPPLDFLPTAERSGLIKEIDRWVIGEAASLALIGRPLAVNLSASSACSPDVLDTIKDALDRHKADPTHLLFELTETAMMPNISGGSSFAERLVELGCELAIDDFGTGFASLTYLKQLPVRYLKIDINFVRDVRHSSRDRAIISAIVSLAAGFGQLTIAEGVEDESTASVLRELGVNLAQGYHYGRPAPVER